MSICEVSYILFYQTSLVIIKNPTLKRHMPPTNKTFQLIKTKGKEGNVLFNDALNTFYLWLYGVKHMVNDHSDSDR